MNLAELALDIEGKKQLFTMEQLVAALIPRLIPMLQQQSVPVIPPGPVTNQGIKKGDIVRVERGRKVPIGTIGVLFWTKESEYGIRAGIRDCNKDVYWTYTKNLELASVTEANDHYNNSEIPF